MRQKFGHHLVPIAAICEVAVPVSIGARAGLRVVALDLVKGVVALRWWPLWRMGRIETPGVLQQGNEGTA